MTGERLISEAELARRADQRGNANRKLGAKAKANRRQNCALDDDVSNTYCSALANPLRLGAHERARKDVVSEKEVSAIRTDQAGVTERDPAGLLRQRPSGGEVRGKS